MTELAGIKGELLLLEGAPGASAAAENLYRQGLDWARRQAGLSSELRCAASLARLSTTRRGRRGPSAPRRNLPSIHRGLRNRPICERQDRRSNR